MAQIVILAEVILLSAIAVAAVVVAYSLLDELWAVARVVKQTYGDAAWRRYGYEQDDSGRRTPILKRDASGITDHDVRLAGMGAIALGLTVGLIALGLLALGGLMLLGI